MSSAICRVCLTGDDVKMHSIEDLQLLETYENLTNNKFNAMDGRPSTVCYMCYWQLKRCSNFSSIAHRAERILKDLMYNGTEITHTTITTLNLGLTQNLSVSTTRHVSTDDSDFEHCSLSTHTGKCQEYTYDYSPLATVKEEYTAIKKEKTIEEVYIKVDSIQKDESFKEERSKGSHALTAHCEQCNKKFKSSRYLKAHMVTHSDQKPFTCDICGKRFNQMSYYKLHMRTHAEGKPFPCSRCSKTFYRKANLNKHIQSHLEEKSYVCDQCSKRFKQRSHLKVHMRIHTGEKSFACEICGKTFNQIANLNKHMGIHTGVKPFSCEQCGKAFLQRAQVKAHMRSHTGEKPYACDRCDMAFSHASPLRKHMRLHIDAKQFVCTICYVSFNQECNLKEHIKVHTERPHGCTKCHKAFTDARNLKRHDVQVHCEERLHACTRCGKTFKRTQHLKKHMTSCRATDNVLETVGRTFYQ